MPYSRGTPFRGFAMPHEKAFFRLLHLVYSHILSRWISHLTYIAYDEGKALSVLAARRDDALFQQKYHVIAAYGHYVFFITGCKKLYPVERAIIDWSVSKIMEYSRNILHDYSMSLAVETVVSHVVIAASMLLPDFDGHSAHRQLNREITFFRPDGIPCNPREIQLFSPRERDIMDRVVQLVHSTELFEASTNEGARFPFTVAFLLGTHHRGDFSLQDMYQNDFIKSLASTRNFFFISENGKFVDYQDVGEGRVPLGGPPCRLQKDFPCAVEDKYILEYIFRYQIKYETKDIFVVSVKENGDILIYKNHALVFFKRKGHWHFLNFCALMDAVNLYLADRRPPYDPEAIGLTVLDMLLKQAGCCLGIISRDMWFRHFEDTKLGSADTFLSVAPSVDRCFWANTRTVRQKILSIDGAVLVLAETGDLLNAGTIIQHDGNASQGARTTAAKRIASLGGMAIKVSDDGYCEIYLPPPPNRPDLRQHFTCITPIFQSGK